MRRHMQIKEVINKVINTFFPHSCLSCKSIVEEFGLCSNCYIQLEHDNSLFISDKIERRSCFIYKTLVRRLITRYKNRKDVLLSELFSNFIVERIVDPQNIDYICAIPIHRIKLLWRTFNQSQNIVNIISKKLNIKSILLKKMRNNSSQKGKSLLERKKNVEEVFSINNNNVSDKIILLIDDVCTTGATITSCANELIKNGAKQVKVFTIART